MYRVMIVDDEKAIRCLLRRTINWEEMNLRVEGEAASGIEAINIIDEIRPDIIFVDIRMPFMNGIEFARFAIKRYPKLKIIILTAYEDFNYAKECIGIGVSDYLLKPIVRAEINDTLHKIIGQLDDERNQAEPDETIDEIGGYSITIEEIIAKANKDLDEKKITGDMIKDGGTMIYNYNNYTIIKCHSLDGNRDVYIGSKDMKISDLSK